MIFLGTKMPEELNEHLRAFKCSALLQRQEKERFEIQKAGFEVQLC